MTRQYAALCKEYGIRGLTGDSYGAEWVAGTWRDAGSAYQKAEQPKGEIYLEAVPLFTRGLVRLPPHTALLRELRLLERRTHRSGRDTVDEEWQRRSCERGVWCVVMLVAHAPLRIHPDNGLAERAYYQAARRRATT